MSADIFRTGIANAAIGVGLVVTLDASVVDGVKLPAAATDFGYGVTFSSTTASGQTIEVQTEGEARVYASATVTRGQRLKYDTAGKVLPVASAGDRPLGVCIKGASANELCYVYIAREFN